MIGATRAIAPSTAEADRRRWFVLATVCLSTTVVAIDNTVVTVAIPSIVQDTGARGAQLQRIIDSYVVVFAGLMLVAGSLGDRVGREKTLLAGLAVFGTVSALAAFATSSNQLIVARAVPGVGAALIVPSGLAVLNSAFQGRERARAIGLWSGLVSVGIAVGPLVGGALVEHFWWGSIFLVNVPVVAVALALGHRHLPRVGRQRERPLDLVGGAFSILTLGALLWAITLVPEYGWSAPPVVLTAAAAAVSGHVFWRWERLIDAPMINRALLRSSQFAASVGTLGLLSFAHFGTTFLLTQYFQFARGMSPSDRAS